MTKELQGGQEYNDGVLVTEYQGRFNKAFEIEPADGVQWAKGDQISFIVTAKVGKRTYDDVKNGDGQARLNVFDIIDATPMDQTRAQWLYDQLGKKVVGVNETFAQPEHVEEDSDLGLFQS